MKKLALILLILIIGIIGCTYISKSKDELSKEVVGKKTLSEIQITACETAHDSGTCDSRLSELGIVLKEDCCEVLGKCC